MIVALRFGLAWINSIKSEKARQKVLLVRERAVVTVNLKDLKTDGLEPYAIDAQHPDVFVRHVLDLKPGEIVRPYVPKWVGNNFR